MRRSCAEGLPAHPPNKGHVSGKAPQRVRRLGRFGGGTLTCHGLPASVRWREPQRRSLVTVCLQVCGPLYRDGAHLSRFACKCAVPSINMALTCHGFPASARRRERRRHSLVTVSPQVRGGGSMDRADRSLRPPQRPLWRLRDGPTASVRPFREGWRFRAGDNHQRAPFSGRLAVSGGRQPPACALIVIAGGSGRRIGTRSFLATRSPRTLPGATAGTSATTSCSRPIGRDIRRLGRFGGLN